MAIERTPDELRHDQLDMARIRAALNRALANLTSLLLADRVLDADPQLCEQLLDATYDQLRADLSCQQMVRAVLMLLTDQAAQTAERIAGQMQAGPDAWDWAGEQR